MDTEERTISLWDEGSSKRIRITLKNRKNGKLYSFVLQNQFIVGRMAQYCNLQITEDDRYISKRHLRFIRQGREVYVEDMQTKNGTRLNGTAISSRTRLHSGDQLRMGRSEYDVSW